MSLKRLALILLAALAALAASAPGASAYESHLDLPYDLDGRTTALNRLDLYTPDGAKADDALPLVVYVHGGGWMRGDKRNRIADKARLFTDSGYVFASVNYRLSPDPPAPSDPDRIRFPAQPADVGEALGWLDRNGPAYGADPERILVIGHSAGSQIVSLLATDPSFVEAHGVAPWQLAGAVSLDTDAFDIRAEATQTRNTDSRTVIWNAFATPAENAATPVWAQASPLLAADPLDAPFLLVTGQNPVRLAANRAMATALGQDPAEVLSLPYSHEGINTALGSANDPAGETAAVTGFAEQAFAAAVGPKAKLSKHPPKKVRTNKRRVHVDFAFKSDQPDSSFQCRLDGAAFERCASPKRLRADRGGHTFRVRALSDRGRPGRTKSFKFRVVRR